MNLEEKVISPSTEKPSSNPTILIYALGLLAASIAYGVDTIIENENKELRQEISSHLDKMKNDIDSLPGLSDKSKTYYLNESNWNTLNEDKEMSKPLEEALRKNKTIADSIALEVKEINALIGEKSK